MVSQLRQKAVLRTTHRIMGLDHLCSVLASTTRTLPAIPGMGLQTCKRLSGLSVPLVENQSQ